MNMNEPPSLLRNDVSGGGHWLKVLLVGVTSNRSAIGARVIARYGDRTQAQEVTAQSSFYSANDRRLHFGLGAATSADLTIRWPNGATETIPGVEADQLVVIREGAGILRTAEVRVDDRSCDRDRLVLLAAGARPRQASAAARAASRARSRSTPARSKAASARTLYGQFIEFMFEGIKRGLHAELIRNRGFEEAPNAIGLSRYWERYPDDRIDDYGIVASPGTTTWRIRTRRSRRALTGGHSLRVEVKPGVIARHGVYQPRVPVRQRLEYRGYLWVKADAFTGDVDGGARSGRHRRPHLRTRRGSRTSRATGRSTRSR